MPALFLTNNATIINPDNVLTTKWELEDADIEVLTKEFGSKSIKNKTVIITKGYDNNRYWDIEIDEKCILNHHHILS